LVRVVVIFTALAARVLTHAGVNKNTLATVHMFTKEFLLSVRELDLRDAVTGHEVVPANCHLHLGFGLDSHRARCASMLFA